MPVMLPCRQTELHRHVQHEARAIGVLALRALLQREAAGCDWSKETSHLDDEAKISSVVASAVGLS